MARTVFSEPYGKPCFHDRTDPSYEDTLRWCLNHYKSIDGEGWLIIKVQNRFEKIKPKEVFNKHLVPFLRFCNKHLNNAFYETYKPEFDSEHTKNLLEDLEMFGFKGTKCEVR